MATTETGGGNGVTGARADNTIFTNEYSSNPSIANITDVAQRKWGGAVGTGVTLTYSFNLGNGNSVYSASYPSDAGAGTAYGLNAMQQNVARQAMDAWAAVANLGFTEMADSSAAGSPAAGDIRWSNSMVPPTALGYYPNLYGASGDIWFGSGQGGQNQNPVSGGYGFATFIHELGHALGLNHPHEGNTPAVAGEDQLKYSIMSYRDFAGDDTAGYNTDFYPSAPMLNDILAIQWMYGVNWGHNNSDNFYFFNSVASVYQTIWDGGGVDTLSAFNQTQGVVINLNSGQWSEIGVAFDNGSGTLVRDNLTIAYGAVIENATGSAYNDRLVGNAVANILEGGLGDDTYANVAPGDTIIELAGQGNDAIEVGYSLDLRDFDGASIESAILTGVGDFSMTGTSGNNRLQGNAGQNVLAGLGGDDTYVVADLGGWNDILLENANEGTDTVNSVLSYTLPDNIENLTLSGPAVSGTGNALDNILQSNYNVGAQLYGLGGNDRLYGFNTSAAMYGGTGDDVYYLDRWGDTVTEYADEGLDTIVVDYGFSLASLPHVENLTLIDPTFVDYIPYKNFGAYGNALNNTLCGNSGHNVLAGGAGDDILLGGDGNDVYLVEGNDYLAEDSAGGGLDRIVSAAGITMPVYFEEAVLTGNLDIDATGNEDANRLLGNAGKNHLRGGAGADVLIGDANVDIHSGVTGTELHTGDAGVSNFVPSYTATSLALGNALIQVDGQTLTGNDQIFVSRFGTLSFGQAFDSLNTDLQAGTEPSLLLAPLWGYWWPSGSDTVLMQLMDDSGDGVDDHLRVQWNTRHDSSVLASQARFQVEIQNGQISYHYFGLDERDTSYDNHHLTIGAVLSDGPLLLSHNRFVQANQTIVIKAGGDDDILDGGSGADTLQGGSGNDQYVVDDFGDVVIEGVGKGTDSVRSTVDFTLAANIENLTLQGPLDIDGTGNDLANTLTGNSGDNTLTGGAGNDILSGDGNTLAPLDNTLLGGMELLAGDAGVSAILGNDDDTSVALDLGAAVITVAGQNFTGDNQLYISSNGLLSFGAAYTESFNTNLQAGTEPAFMLAALWDDWVTNRDAQDQVLVKLSDDNSDGIQDHLQVQWDVHHYSAGNNLVSFQVEIANGQVKYHYFNLDTGNSGTANGVSATLGLKVPETTELLAFNQTVSGWGTLRWAAGAGNDRLDGGAGADTLTGGGGDDRYFVDNAGDVVTELVGEGYDIVFTDMDYSLGANLERLNLTEGSGATTGSGNADDNYLVGNSNSNTLNGDGGNDLLKGLGGNDTLDGGAGADTLYGGAGDDVYLVDDTGDVVSENAGEGTDSVRSTVSLTLKSNVENLSLLGSGNLNGYGNGLDNVLSGTDGDNILSGGAGNDTLEGGAGLDTLKGGTGDDLYILDSLTDVIVEKAGEGTDTIRIGQAFSLSTTAMAQIENLTLTGIGDESGTGNAQNNIIIGNSGTNLLDGKAGADGMAGGAGNDRYLVENIGDTVTELAGEGDDFVYSRTDFVLGANVERLYLMEGGALVAGGSVDDNLLNGNSNSNTMNGGLGNDYLRGGLGNDLYLFMRGDGSDMVWDQDATAGNTDELRFLAGIAHDQLWFAREGSGLVMRVIGSSDKVTVRDWYAGGDNRVEEIRTVDGNHVLTEANVQNLVTAMAGLTPPAFGQTTLDAGQHAALDAVIAASWS